MVNRVESHLLNGIDFIDIFQDLVDNDEFGVAISDKKGVLLFQNGMFTRSMELELFTLNFAALIAVAESNPEERTSFRTFETPSGGMKLSVKRVQGNDPNYFLWISVPSSDSNHNVLILKNLYRSFVDTSFELNFRTAMDGTILFTNRSFLKSFGIDNHQKAWMTSIQSYFLESEHYTDVEKKIVDQKRIHSEEVCFKKQNGEKLVGLVNAYLHYDQVGEPVINWTVLDISRQSTSENALKLKNEQLEKVNHQMEKFLYSTSHDLRSPITSILGLVNLMRMDSRDPMINDYVSKIEKSTLRLDKIIKDIMSFSRTNYQRVSSERIDYDLLSWTAINTYRSEPVFRKINFEVKINGAYPFFGDNERLEIIFDNIIRNSIHFYDANKSRPFIRIEVTLDKTFATLEFIDNGIGIGRKHLESIFNMFYKASHLSKGAGLGLYIVKETIQDLGGSIEVESEIGFGTVFRFKIPNDHKGKLISRKMELQNNL